MEKLNIATPTPFFADETIHFEVFPEIIHHLYDKGIRSFLVSGSTGEQHSLTIDEKIKIIKYFTANQDKLPDAEFIFGVAATTTKAAIRLIKALEDSIFTGVMIGFPPYIRPSQEQAITYVNDLIKRTTKQVALYNNPKRTGFDLEAASLEILVKQNPQIIALKEGGDILRHEKVNLPNDFIFFHAADVQLIENFSLGYNGLSSVVGNVYPEMILHTLNQLLANDPVEARQVNAAIAKVNEIQAIIHVKNHFNQLGIEAGICRAPISL